MDKFVVFFLKSGPVRIHKVSIVQLTLLDIITAVYDIGNHLTTVICIYIKCIFH